VKQHQAETKGLVEGTMGLKHSKSGGAADTAIDYLLKTTLAQALKDRGRMRILAAG
jgi:hypothetical protein